MPRMFDILKGKVEIFRESSSDKSQKKEPASKKDTHLSVSFPRQIRDNFNTQEKAKNTEDTAAISKKLIEAVRQKGIDSSEAAGEKYDYSLKVVEGLLGRIKREEQLDVDINEIYHTVDMLTNQLILGDSLLESVTEEGVLEDYLPRHITNVCTLSLAVGMRMHFNKSKLHILGMAALLHDIGMLRVEDIAKQPRKLSSDETKKIKAHTWECGKFLPEAEGHFNFIKEIIQQHHERINGSGYPLGLKRNEINEYAKIIGLVDTYEAMTHPRSFRKARLPHEAIRELVQSLKLYFDSDKIKALVDKLSIYPVGSFVRLSNKEIAKVISSNPDSPLRPRILILFSSNGNYMPERKVLDLSESNSIHIREPLSLAELGYKYLKKGGG